MGFRMNKAYVYVQGRPRFPNGLMRASCYTKAFSKEAGSVDADVVENGSKCERCVFLGRRRGFRYRHTNTRFDTYPIVEVFYPELPDGVKGSKGTLQ